MYSRHLIFFITYEWAQYARVFHYNRLERLAKEKHSRLFGQFVNSNENEGL